MNRPINIEESVRIGTAPDEVWAMVADYTSDHLWRPGIIEMTPDPPGPPAVGTRVHEVLKTGGRSYVTDSTVTAVGPGMRYRFSGTGTSGIVEGGRSVDSASVPGQAVFTYSVELTLKGAMRLLRPIVASQMRKVLRSDLERLRQVLENSDAAPGSPTTDLQTRDQRTVEQPAGPSRGWFDHVHDGHRARIMAILPAGQRPMTR